ncbi:MAG: autotransporter domain-containing protein [Betaproteobacteria bacterium]
MLAAGALLLLSASPGANATLALYNTYCLGCHPGGPVKVNFNAAGNVAIITAANTAGMGAGGTLGEHISIANYLATVTPAITNAAVPFNSGGTVISIPDLALSAYTRITSVATVTGPTKGSVSYSFGANPTVTYTPTIGQSGADSFTYRGSGPGGTTTTRTATVIIANPPAPVVSSANTASGTGGQAFSYQITATNSPTSFGASGLPAGVSVNTGTGLISGTPTVAGVFNATVSATNAGGTGNLGVTITIGLVAPVITSSTVASGNGGQPFTYTITANNLPSSFNATGLPAGLSVNTGTGVISGTPTATGLFNVMMSATNGAGTDTKTLALTINLVTPVITSSLTANATSGSPFSYTITANNLPSSFNATGLPSGLSIDTSTGVISGTPVVAMGGPVNVMISATNGGGTDTKTLVITVSLNAPTITSANTAAATSGQAFNFQVTATDFPSSFSATGLPAGLSINVTTGLITGTPTVAMTTAVPVMITASNGSGTSPAQTLTITITLPAPVITSPATASGTQGFPFSYQITATNSPTSFNATGLPAGLTVNTTTGVISGSPTTLGTSNVTISAINASSTTNQALTITVSNQPTPNASAVTIPVPFNTQITFDLTGSLSGAYTSVAIASQVSHGLLVLNGTTITYTPNTGYFGTDSFTFTATGPGGTSSPAVATLQVGTPAAPTAAAKAVTVTFNTATAIDLTASITGISTTVSIATPPEHGTATVNGKTVTYTPTSGYFGDDVFSYAATGPGGTSLPADVTIKVTPLAPSADTVTLILPLNTPTVLDLAPFVRGTALTGVAMAGPPLHGTVTVNGLKVTYTPKQDYFGSDTFTYIAFGTAGKSAPATVKVTIVGRPDPAKDANVTGLLAAQTDAAQRFSRAQITNFQGRMETLHRSGDSGVAVPAAPAAATTTPAQTARASASTTAGPLDPLKPNADNKAPANSYQANSFAGPVPAGTQMPYASNIASLLSTRSLNVASLVTASAGGAGGADGTAGGVERNPLNFWISGVANFGRRVANGQRSQLDFTTDGLSVGVDRRFGSKFAAGVGVGFARDTTDIGTDGSKSRARSASVAAYASYHPTQNTFVDGLIGAGSLNFKTQRYVAPMDAFASDDRSGSQLFASLASGYEYRSKGFLLSPYVRVDYTSDRLKQSTESGAGQYALTYFSQTTPSLQGVLGLRAESMGQTNYGWATPRARIEYRREFQGERDASIAYADLTGGTRYAFSTGAVVRNALLVGIGADFIRRGGLTVGLDYQLLHNFSKDSQQGIRLNFTQDLDSLGTPFAVRGFFSIPQKPEKIQFDAGYMFDSNVPRAKENADKRADRAYSANIGKGFVFTFEDRENLRASTTVTLGGEKFQNYDGLSRRIAGIEGDVQYRTSADFDAMTYSLFGRASIERYRSSLRDGYRYSIGVSARRSLTDRIDIFAAIAHNERIGDSAVFSNRDNSVRINLDYSLSDRETLYATGEYRRGQTFSTGRASLDNLDVAEVFVLDDAFPGGQFFSYRFDANTIISTVGYNLGFGPRHSLDLSWRRAKSTPRMQSGASSGTSSYIADQYSIVYLIRF